MGTLFGLLSFLLVISSIVVVFKPSLVRQRSRFKAFILCWMLASIAAMVGSAIDGAIPWSAALMTVVLFLSGFWLMGRGFKGLANKRASANGQNAKVPPQFSTVFSKKGHKSASVYSVDAKTSRSDVIDKFEQSLTTLWAGEISGVEFTYVSFDGERSRRQVDVEELMFNEQGQFYLRGFCHKRQEQRTFKVMNIETKLKVGSKRYEFEEWCYEILGLSAEVIDDIQSIEHR